MTCQLPRLGPQRGYCAEPPSSYVKIVLAVYMQQCCLALHKCRAATAGRAVQGKTGSLLAGLTLPAAIAQLEGVHFAGLPVSNIQAVSAVIYDQLVRHRHGAFVRRQLNVPHVLALSCEVNHPGVAIPICNIGAAITRHSRLQQTIMSALKRQA